MSTGVLNDSLVRTLPDSRRLALCLERELATLSVGLGAKRALTLQSTR
jgi:hypothetical protein